MYSHLSKQQRIEFGALRRAGLSLRATARLLGVHHASLSRELCRNRNTNGRGHISGYHAGDAHRKAQVRRLSANQRFRKIQPGSRLEALLVEKIQKLKTMRRVAQNVQA